MNGKGLIGRYASAGTYNAESDAAIAEAIPASASIADVIDSAVAELAEVSVDQQQMTEELSVIAEESVALENSISGLTTILNMESIVEDLEGNDTTAAHATALVQNTVVDALIAIDPELVQSDVDEVSLEMDVTDAAKRFWLKVKEIVKRVKDNIIGLFNSIVTRFSRAWDNFVTSSARLRKAAIYLKDVVTKISKWDESITLKGRSQWLVEGKLDSKLITGAIRDQVKVSRAMQKEFSEIVKDFKTVKDIPVTGNMKFYFNNEVLKQEEGLSYVGFERQEDSKQYVTGRLDADATFTIGSKNDISRMASDVAMLCNFVEGEMNRAFSKDMKDAKKATEEAIKEASKILSSSETARLSDADKKALNDNLKMLRAKQSSLAELVTASAWLFKGLPLRSATNAISFGTAAVSAVTKAAA